MSPSEHRLSSKRKLEDDDYADLVSVRMRKDEIAAVHSLATAKYQFRVSDTNYLTSVGELRRSAASTVQFFVKMISATRKEPSYSMSTCESLVIQSNLTDSVRSVHEKIEARTGVPMDEQRLIYRGKQLEWDKTLEECSIENDAGLQLVARMRSTEYPLAWQAIDSMMSSVRDMSIRDLRSKCCKFLQTIPKSNTDNDVSPAASYFQIFLSSPVPAALVMLYLTSDSNNKKHAKEMIMDFVKPIGIILDDSMHTLVAPIVLEFCKLFHKLNYKGNLYHACRSSLASLVKTIGVSSSTKNVKPGMPYFEVKDCFPFICEVSSHLSVHLLPRSSLPSQCGTFEGDVCDFTAFVHPLQKAIMKQVKLHGPISMPIQKDSYKHCPYADEISSLHFIFMDLLSKMNSFLQRMEIPREAVGVNDMERGLSEHLAILEALDGLSKLFLGSEKLFWTLMRLRKVSVCNLIIKHVKRSEENSEDNQWLTGHEDVTNFECRRHLVMMMLPEGEDDYEEQQEMLIDRADILEESFEYIGNASPLSLRSGLFLEFKNEEATGPGVLREWFFLVCQALFNPQNALFVACPDDRRRFYPNPASKVNPLHLEYFSFCGRMIALALMHKVRIGIVFDRVFFVQLAGRGLSLEDIHGADPCLYNSCKQILGMDVEFIDSDGLGLTFVQEIEELGSRKIVELCPGGKFRVVNSRNRDLYVTLLIQHRFVRSIAEQVSHFAQGFADILLNSDHQKPFFRSLTLEDFDLMLRGSESPICVRDWKLHTKYNGYKESDRQILWFWKILGEMSAEQRKTLLFFWTSVKFLPFEGFSGFASPLHIYKTKEPHDRLPSSHTCFLRLSFPAYPSINVMRLRFNIITQEHIGCSFGSF